MTTSFREIEIDTLTGKIVREGDTNDWTGCKIIAYGKVMAGGAAGVYEMDPVFPVKGLFASGTRFQGKGIRDLLGYRTLCLNRASGGPYVVSKVLPSLNGVTVK